MEVLVNHVLVSKAKIRKCGVKEPDLFKHFINSSWDSSIVDAFLWDGPKMTWCMCFPLERETEKNGVVLLEGDEDVEVERVGASAENYLW